LLRKVYGVRGAELTHWSEAPAMPDCR
jgi:hypothetical protein